MIGYGDHWNLEVDEKKALGARLAECTDTMESNPYFEKLAEVVGKVGPWVALVGTAAVITAPRVAMTRAAMEEQRRRAAENAEPSAPNVPPSPNGNRHAAYSRM